MIFNKNTHTFERSTAEIDEREYIKDISINKLSLFTHKSLQVRKQISHGDLLREMFTSFFHSGVLGIPRVIFQRYHPGLLMADAMQNPRRLSILGYVLKPETVEGRFKTDNLDIFHIS